jgi:hypothetical protein
MGRLLWSAIISALLLRTSCTASADVFGPVKGSTFTAPEEEIERVKSFIGVDATPAWLHVYGGATLAPYGHLSTSGFRLWIYGESGTYRYLSSPTSTVRGAEQLGDVLVGYGFSGETYSLNLFIGANVDNQKLFSPDPENSVQGTKFGGKIRAEFWTQPTSWSLLCAEADYSTAFQRYHVLGHLGFETFSKGVFLGPEVSVMGNEQYNQWRVGAHLTAVRQKYGEVNLSVGYAMTSDFRPGAYGMLELDFRF